MTHVARAQDFRQEVALRKEPAPHSLAARRAAFAAQMRDMALSELDQVAERLKALQAELERKDARKWTQQDVAQKAGVPYRTYQSWLGAKVENALGDDPVYVASQMGHADGGGLSMSVYASALRHRDRLSGRTLQEFDRGLAWAVMGRIEDEASSFVVPTPTNQSAAS